MASCYADEQLKAKMVIKNCEKPKINDDQL